MLKKGDTVRVRCDGRLVEAHVVIASQSQLSAAITFEAILAGHVGAMPLTRESTTMPWRSLVSGVIVEVEESDGD